LYANGKVLREQALAPSSAPGVKARLVWRLPRPRRDQHLVLLSTGPGVTSSYWAIPRPYQPSSKAWTPRVAGSSNPIWIDGDGDGRFTSAKDYARQWVDRHGPSPERLLPALDEAGCDEVEAIQVAARCRAMGQSIDSAAFHAVLSKASPAVRAGFQRYEESR